MIRSRVAWRSRRAYGDRIGFEWPQVSGEKPVVFKAKPGPLDPGQRGRPTEVQRLDLPDFSDRLPAPLRGYGGPIPHLVHEFVQSALHDRPPATGATIAGNWTAAGICAHESAMRGGEGVDVPVYSG